MGMGGCEVSCENEACGAIRGAAVGAADWEGWSDGDGDEVGVWFRFAVFYPIPHPPNQ